MSEQRGLVPTHEVHDEAEIMLIAYQRYGEIANLKNIQSQLVDDLEEALNLVIAYQRCLLILRSPDPNFVQARRLLSKYKMVGVEPASEYKIYSEGIDITLHPDSVESTAVEDQDPERAELVQDEHGNIRLRPVIDL